MEKLKYYPAYLDIKGKKVVVVGGGGVAKRKIAMLLSAGAQITVVSPEVDDVILALKDELAEIKIKKYTQNELQGAFIVIAATNQQTLNRKIAADAKALNMLVNVVAPPEESNFIVPSVVNKGEIVISISTSATSPALAKKIRKDIEKQYGNEYRIFIKLLGIAREILVKNNRGDSAWRGSILNSLVDSDILLMLKEGDYEKAVKEASRIAGVKFDKEMLEL